jgi:hypothetical protein
MLFDKDPFGRAQPPGMVPEYFKSPNSLSQLTNITIKQKGIKRFFMGILFVKGQVLSYKIVFQSYKQILYQNDSRM